MNEKLPMRILKSLLFSSCFCAFIFSAKPHVSFLHQASFGLDLLAGLVKIKPSVNTPYHDLSLTADDIDNITFIISSMGELSAPKLLIRSSELYKRGDKIEEAKVHPLKFLVVVFRDKYLKEVCMRNILNSGYKKKNFLNGLGKNMTSEAERGRLQKYLPDFMKEINLDQKHLQNLMEFVDKRDWEGFLWYIIEN